ncbi:MAG: CehA/McbA family metallohydrolase, partial [Candidatus Thermoplasmatota archaeon]
KITTNYWYNLKFISQDKFEISGYIGKINIKATFVLCENGIDALKNDYTTKVNTKISGYELPKMKNWYYGDAHFHTAYTDNMYEFGAPIDIIEPVANSVGLNWLTVTDHSFDLDPNKWEKMRREIEQQAFNFIQGEEISAYIPSSDTTGYGNYKYNHYLAYGIKEFIPGGEWEDGTYSTYTPSQVVKIVEENGGIGYVAHPFYEDEFRLPWIDYSLNFTGLQIWNGGSGDSDEMKKGIEKWVSLLLEKRNIFIIGGNDAHGDFFKLGKVKTLAYAGNLTKNDIMQAMRNGKIIITDGPIIFFEVMNEKGKVANIGERIVGLDFKVRIFNATTPEFGDISSIKMYIGKSNKEFEYKVEKNELNITNLIAPEKDSYIRFNAVSMDSDGVLHYAYTNPIWIKFENKRPIAIITCENNVKAGKKILFDGGASYDPDGEIKIFEWDFNNDGTPDANGMKIEHRFEKKGTYKVSLKVFDDDNEYSIAYATIYVEEEKKVIDGFEASSFIFILITIITARVAKHGQRR